MFFNIILKIPEKDKSTSETFPRNLLVFFNRLYNRLLITCVNGGFGWIWRSAKPRKELGGKKRETEKEYDYSELKWFFFAKLAFREFANDVSTFSFIYSKQFPKSKTSVFIFYLHSFHFFLITVCPREKPFKMCIYDKCLSSPGCASHPSAQCQMNYCGECTAEYFDENGRKVDCTNGKTIKYHSTRRFKRE